MEGSVCLSWGGWRVLTGGFGKHRIDGLSWGLFSITFGRLGWGWAGWHTVVVSGQMMMVEEEEEAGERREG